MQHLVAQTLAQESGVLRYEYWRAQAPHSYYCLLAFRDKHAFFVHQDSPYHREAPFAKLIESVELEFVDPVPAAAPLPRTSNPALPPDSPPGIAEWEKLTPVRMAAWWPAAEAKGHEDRDR
jgi:hypothetical protein